MQYDYYAFRKEQLSDHLNELEQATLQRDKNARKQAIENATKKVIQLEPHLCYLWYEDQNSELKNSIRDAWYKHLTASPIPTEFQFLPKASDFNHLPFLSFMLRVPFALQKPYLSKDDRAFHLLDNSVRKDKVFQTPIVAPASWKGALHHAMLQQFAKWWCDLDEEVREQRQHSKDFIARRVSISRLFGTEKRFQIADEEFEGYLDKLGNNCLTSRYQRYIKRYLSTTGFFSGRLYFYPTFFDQIGLEVINPHDRKKGTSKHGPIYLECVPKGVKGELVILYVPFGKIDESQVAKDLELVAKGIKAMLTVYGFGAKTSSGFGVADQQATGKIVINYRYSPSISSPPQKPEYPQRLRVFLEQYPNEDFRLKPNEWRKLHHASQPQRESYQNARNEYSTYQRELANYESELAKWQTQANAPPLPRREEDFSTLDELVLKAQEIAQSLPKMIKAGEPN